MCQQASTTYYWVSNRRLATKGPTDFNGKCILGFGIKYTFKIGIYFRRMYDEIYAFKIVGVVDLVFEIFTFFYVQTKGRLTLNSPSPLQRYSTLVKMLEPPPLKEGRTLAFFSGKLSMYTVRNWIHPVTTSLFSFSMTSLAYHTRPVMQCISVIRSLHSI
jgi:hypothetical protein